MLLLTSTSDLVRAITDAAADIEVHASWVDHNAGTITPGRTNTASVTTATTTTVVGSPAASTQRNVKFLSFRNNHASTSCNVDVDHTDGTNAEELIRATLLAGESLVFDELGRWIHYDVNGGEYPRHGAPGATQAEMETGTALDRVVAPGRQHFHPGHPKFYAVIDGAGFLRPASSSDRVAYNISSITDTGAGLMTVNFVTAFSSVNYCALILVQRSSTSLTVTNQKFCAIRSATQAAGAFTAECWDGTATTAVQEDPNRWYVMGLGDQ